MTETCLFCKMEKGEIPVVPIYEDEWVFAIDDIAPQAPVHVLIIPKEHVANLNDQPSPELLGHLFSAVERIAELKSIKQSGYRLIQNNGDDAGQTIHHLHVHVLGGRSFGEGMV